MVLALAVQAITILALVLLLSGRENLYPLYTANKPEGPPTDGRASMKLLRNQPTDDRYKITLPL